MNIYKKLTNYDIFQVDLFQAMLKWKAFESGYIQPLWNDSIQNQINAFSNLATGNFELESHFIACRSFFGKEIDDTLILESFSYCLKLQPSNKESFTNCLYNRLNKNMDNHFKTE